MIFILSEQRLKNDFNDVINLQSSTIQQATRTAQDIYLRSIIGDYLLDTLEDMILNDTLTGEYKLLIDNYCIPYLEYRTMAELQMSTFKINNAGANQVYDSNVNTLSVEQVKYLEQQYINKASYYENRMTKYLIQSGIPEYKMKSGITNASTTITEQTGIFLGGTKTKTTKRTTSNKNSGGAVRYDIQQNLSEQEKQQARENIGVSANGEIDVDLTDYYTKNEVDTLIAEIPTFSGNYNDLSNKPSVDIMTLPYSEQYNVLQYLVDNNVLPYTVSYNGVVLNNLPVEISWWDEEQNQRQIIFSVYGVQSYDIRFITYQWNEGKIYNDINEKDETENLVKKGELFGLSYNNLNDKPIVDLLSLPYNEQVNQIDFYSDINVFVGGYIMTIEGIILNGNKCVYEIIGEIDGGMPIKQVDFHINRTKDSFIIRFITRYDEANENIPYEFIYTNENGDTLDTLNLVTKSELEETIGNINNILNTI